jgi:hypothetical protein
MSFRLSFSVFGFDTSNMISLSSHSGWLLGLAGGFVLVSIVLINTVPFFGMACGALSGGPGLGLIRDIRSDLLAQEPFVQTLTKHEQEALQRYRTSGTTVYQRRHLVQVNLTPLGLPGSDHRALLADLEKR